MCRRRIWELLVMRKTKRGSPIMFDTNFVVICLPVSEQQRACSVEILQVPVPDAEQQNRPWRTGEKVTKIQILLFWP